MWGVGCESGSDSESHIEGDSDIYFLYTFKMYVLLLLLLITFFYTFKMYLLLLLLLKASYYYIVSEWNIFIW